MNIAYIVDSFYSALNATEEAGLELTGASSLSSAPGRRGWHRAVRPYLLTSNKHQQNNLGRLDRSDFLYLCMWTNVPGYFGPTKTRNIIAGSAIYISAKMLFLLWKLASAAKTGRLILIILRFTRFTSSEFFFYQNVRTHKYLQNAGLAEISMSMWILHISKTQPITYAYVNLCDQSMWH